MLQGLANDMDMDIAAAQEIGELLQGSRPVEAVFEELYGKPTHEHREDYPAVVIFQGLAVAPPQTDADQQEHNPGIGESRRCPQQGIEQGGRKSLIQQKKELMVQMFEPGEHRLPRGQRTTGEPRTVTCQYCAGQYVIRQAFLTFGRGSSRDEN